MKFVRMAAPIFSIRVALFSFWVCLVLAAPLAWALELTSQAAAIEDQGGGGSSVTGTVSDTFCFSYRDRECAVSWQFFGVTVQSSGDSLVLQLERNPDGTELTEVSLNEDLQSRALSGEIDADDLPVIENELREKIDVRYRLPANESELKASVGFVQEIDLLPKDQIELLQVHLQIEMRVSLETARYLAMRLGVAAFETASTSNRN